MGDALLRRLRAQQGEKKQDIPALKDDNFAIENNESPQYVSRLDSLEQHSGAIPPCTVVEVCGWIFFLCFNYLSLHPRRGAY